MAVALVLTALTMPAMRQVHENAQRVMCMANLQQMGHGFTMYGGDHADRLPHSTALGPASATPQQLMRARRADGTAGWDGIGRLYELNYCGASECFYCPSHHGSHPAERYSKMWTQASVTVPIYTNYHYAGQLDWRNNNTRRSLLDPTLVLATDGLRTKSDFNHLQGMNVLRADGSVRWRDDTDAIYQLLPRSEQEPTGDEYLSLWEMVAAID